MPPPGVQGLCSPWRATEARPGPTWRTCERTCVAQRRGQPAGCLARCLKSALRDGVHSTKCNGGSKREGARGENRVEFGAGHFPVVLSERRQYNTLDDTSRERMLLRGTWFFQRSDGTLQPYSEDIAHTLELSFSSHHRSCSGCFDTLWRALTFAKLCSRVHKCAWGCWARRWRQRDASDVMGDSHVGK